MKIEAECSQEQKENYRDIDFKKIFDEKLASIEPIGETERLNVVQGLDRLGIKVKKLAPCLNFGIDKTAEGGTRNSYSDLWIEDDKDIRNAKDDYGRYDIIKQPHHYLEHKLDDYLESSELELGLYLPGYIIQDEKNEIYLIVPHDFGKIVAEARGKSIEGKQDYFDILEKYLRLLHKYNIKQIIGKFRAGELEKRKEIGYGSGAGKVLDINFDLFGEIGENRYLGTFGEKYKMTNTQYLRFWLRAKAGFEAQKEENKKEPEEKTNLRYLVDLDKLAKEVIEQGKYYE
jgi:hypothetical protein